VERCLRKFGNELLGELAGDHLEAVLQLIHAGTIASTYNHRMKACLLLTVLVVGCAADPPPPPKSAPPDFPPMEPMPLEPTGEKTVALIPEHKDDGKQAKAECGERRTERDELRIRMTQATEDRKKWVQAHCKSANMADTLICDGKMKTSVTSEEESMILQQLNRLDRFITCCDTNSFGVTCRY